jgi:hypothetical protein
VYPLGWAAPAKMSSDAAANAMLAPKSGAIGR